MAAGQRGAFYTKYQEIDSYVRNNFFGDINENELLLSVFNGYILGIGDKYAQYRTPDEYYELQQSESGSFITAGMVTEPETGGYLLVTDVLDGSSAEHLGVQPGDFITIIDGVSVLELGVARAQRNLSGDEGTRLNIVTMRDGVENRHTLIRQRIDIITARGVASGAVGYIRITGFNRLTDFQFITIYEQMETNQVRALIIDLRETDGVLLTPLRNILNRLVGTAALATARDKAGNVANIITTEGEPPPDLPIVVLIDSGTKRYAELFAAILRDFKSAQLVGTVSAGDATMTNTQVFRDGSALTISVAKVKSAASPDFDEVGIMPDFIVEMSAPIEQDIANIENTTDLQLKKAFDILSSIIQ